MTKCNMTECKKCGAEINERSNECKECGFPVFSESEVLLFYNISDTVSEVGIFLDYLEKIENIENTSAHFAISIPLYCYSIVRLNILIDFLKKNRYFANEHIDKIFNKMKFNNSKCEIKENLKKTDKSKILDDIDDLLNSESCKKIRTLRDKKIAHIEKNSKEKYIEIAKENKINTKELKKVLEKLRGIYQILYGEIHGKDCFFKVDVDFSSDMFVKSLELGGIAYCCLRNLENKNIIKKESNLKYDIFNKEYLSDKFGGLFNIKNLFT